MMGSRGYLHVLVLFLVLNSAVSGGTIEITGSGTWSASTPVTTLSAPDAMWSFSMVVPDPLPGTVDSYGDYTSTVSSAQYLLNGTAVNDAIESLTYYGGGGPDGGLFDIDFAHGTLTLFGAQIYDANLNLIPGDYSARIKDDTGSGTGDVLVGVPEPATVISASWGLLSAAALWLGNRRRHSSNK